MPWIGSNSCCSFFYYYIGHVYHIYCWDFIFSHERIYVIKKYTKKDNGKNCWKMMQKKRFSKYEYMCSIYLMNEKHKPAQEKKYDGEQIIFIHRKKKSIITFDGIEDSFFSFFFLQITGFSILLLKFITMIKHFTLFR